MIEIQEIRYERRYDIGICAITSKKKYWNSSCFSGFKLCECLNRKAHMVCMNCANWKGTSKLEQSKLGQ